MDLLIPLGLFALGLLVPIIVLSQVNLGPKTQSRSPRPATTALH